MRTCRARRTIRLRRAGAVALLILAAGAARADEKPTARFDSLRFRSVGPAAGGRVSRAVGLAGDPNVYYAATAQGGVWKSTDGGHAWKPIFDDQPVASIGSIAVSPADPNLVWVGSGEANIRGNVIAGQGIFRSTDGGKTWSQVWKQVGQIGTVAAHPTDPRIAFAAVLGHAFGPNEERGVYRTTDGGASWRRVLYRDPETGASDVAIDPSNPRVVFAGLWQARRRPWELTSGGPGGGLYRSTDGGDSWTRLTVGLPEGPWGKVGVAVAPSDPRRVYALVEATEGGLFRSDDGGGSWRRVNAHRSLRQRAWYYSTITVDPTNADLVWFPQVPLLRSKDGGRTIAYVGGWAHGDHHDLWIDPANPKRMIVANDGGVELTEDGGETWRRPRLPIAQLYNVDADRREPFRVGGTMQDEGTASGPSRTLRSEGIALGDWRVAGGGEAGDFVYDPFEPGIVYAGEYGGIVTVHDEATGDSRNVSIYPTNPSGHGAEDLRVRFQWTAPIAVSPHEPGVLYHGANVLFRSRDRGRSWQAVSPDLTRDDVAKQKWSGGPITGDNTGVEVYGTIFSLALSPLERDLIWAGTDDGLVHRTRDAGTTWSAVTPPGVPEWSTIECIEASPHAAGTAWVVADAHRLDDQRPHLFRTDDHGASWRDLSAGLPADEPLFVVREDPERRELLYAGTERGVHVSFDGGARWEPLDGGLPTVKVADLVVRGASLVAGTSGRSIWILDDLSPVRAWSAEVERAPVHLFAPVPARRWRLGQGWGGEALAENPPYGSVLHYRLAAAVEGEVVLEITDPEGRLVRRLSSVARQPEFAEDDPDEPTKKPEPALSSKAGLHRVAWDLAWQGADRLEKAKVDLGGYEEGPLAAPGRYRATLRAGGGTATAELEVLPDPRSRVPAAELVEQQEAALVALQDVRAVLDDIRAVRAVVAQAEALRARLGAESGRQPLAAALDRAANRGRALERELHNPDAEVVYDILARPGGAKLLSKLVFLYESIRWGDGAPTQGAREVGAELRTERERLHGELAALLASDVAEVDRLAAELALPRILVP
jgi:photosystem II stability/assembly factor-like uncharacterized protein